MKRNLPDCKLDAEICTGEGIPIGPTTAQVSVIVNRDTGMSSVWLHANGHVLYHELVDEHGYVSTWTAPERKKQAP